jgi:hypothetical protein
LTVRVTRAAVVALTIAASCVLAGCTAKSQPVSRTETIWRPLGSWSGKTNLQTESFPGESGAMRIRWETKNASEPAAPFTLTMHSAISGRPLEVMVEQKGNGEGTAYLSEDPRVFFAVVDAANLDWTFTIEEPVDVILTPR